MRHIKDAQLKSGENIRIYQSDTLIDSKAVSLMLRLYADLIDNKFTLGSYFGFNKDSSIIWAEHDNKAIGGICYKNNYDIFQCWIEFSFTHPEWRNKGVNYFCHTELEEICKYGNIQYISSQVNVNNIARIKSCEKVGLKPTFYRMHKVI